MEITGINDFILFRTGTDGKLLTDVDAGALTTNMNKPGLFKVDAQSSRGATQANITGLAATTTKVYGSNVVTEQTIGTISPSIALGANDIPHEIYDNLAGLTKDQLGGYGYKSSVMVTGGVIAHSRNTNLNIDLFFAFPSGVFTAGELNMQTNTENPVVQHDALTLAAQARTSDELLYEKFYSNAHDFDYDKMLAYITGASITNSPGTPEDNE